MADAKDILITLATDIIREVGRTVVEKVRQHARQHLMSDAERDAMFQRQLDELYGALVGVGQAFETTNVQPISETTEIVERDGTEEYTKPYAHLRDPRD